MILKNVLEWSKPNKVTETQIKRLFSFLLKMITINICYTDEKHMV